MKSKWVKVSNSSMEVYELWANSKNREDGIVGRVERVHDGKWAAYAIGSSTKITTSLRAGQAHVRKYGFKIVYHDKEAL